MSRSLRFPITVALILVPLIVTVPVHLGAQTSPDSYRIEVRLDEERQVIQGKEKIEFTNGLSEPTSEIVLILRANLHKEPNPYLSKINLDNNYPAGFDAGWTRVRKITGPAGTELSYQSESLPPTSQTYSLEETVLRVNLEEPVAPGETSSMVVEFSTKFPEKMTGDEEYYRKVYLWRFGWYPTLAPLEWWKGYDRRLYSQSKFRPADYDVRLNVPEDFTTTGNKMEGITQEGDSERKLLRFGLDGARSFPLTGSTRYRKFREQFDKFSVEVLHLPGYQERARVLASYANEILKFYSEEFGEYKREKLSFAQSPISGYFGMAADGLVVLGNSFFSENDLVLSTVTNRLSEYLIAHEIAHQWFGIGVGADFDSQNWISEAFAEFLALRYFHHKYPEYGPNLFRFERSGLIRNAIESQLGYINLRDHMFELPYIVNFQDGFDEAIVKPTEDVKYNNATQTRIYKKGYLVLRTLEGAIGEKAMNEFLSDLYKRYHDGIIDVDLLASEAGELAGEEIPDDFFQEWLFTDEYLDYGIDDLSTEKTSNGGYSNQIVVTKSGSLTAPVVLRATLTSGEEVTRTIQLETDRKSISWETPKKIKKVTIDPGSLVMDVNRLNNHYPRKVEISLGGNKLPLDAYFLLIGAGTVTGRTPNKVLWTIGPGYAQGSLNLNRNLSFSGGISVKGDSLSNLNVNGWLGAQVDLWSNPETGSAAQYWTQNRTLNLQLERVTGDERTYNLLAGSLDLSQSVSENRNLELGSTFSLGGEGKFFLSAQESERIFPNVYLNLSTSLGFGLGDLPSLMKFGLTELKSYGEWETDPSGKLGWNKYLFPGNYKLFSRISLGFPLSGNENYYLGSLALVKQVRQTVFVSGGDTWDSPAEVGLDDFKFELGTALSIQGKTLGGLMPFDFTVGYAYHGQDTGRPFFNFSLSL